MCVCVDGQDRFFLFFPFLKICFMVNNPPKTSAVQQTVVHRVSICYKQQS